MHRQGKLVMVKVMSEPSTKRVIVDPSVREAERVFQRMLERLKNTSREDHLAAEIRRGRRNEDGSPKLPEEPPYLSGG